MFPAFPRPVSHFALPVLVAATLAIAATATAESKVQLDQAQLTTGIPGEGPLSAEEIDRWVADAENHEELDFELPLGLHAGQGMVRGVNENPLTRAKVELGRQLFSIRDSRQTTRSAAPPVINRSTVMPHRLNSASAYADN